MFPSKTALVCVYPFVLLVACVPENEVIGREEDPVQLNPRTLAARHQVDRVVQVRQPTVDVLWVIDNSCSMDMEQRALADNFPSFLEWFLGSGLDYHIGVVSTDMVHPDHRGRLRAAAGYRYLDDATDAPQAVFAQMVEMGTTGSGEEEGLSATHAALETLADAYNAGFYRDDAVLHVIVTSDEDDQSRSITASEFVRWFRGLKWSEDRASLSAIVTMGNPCDADDGSRGETYLDIAEVTGGMQWDICSEDWQPVLDGLGIEASGLRREYFLSRLPVADTIAVRVEEPDGVVFGMAPREYTYGASRNSITFDSYVPSPLSTVVVEYDVRGVGADTSGA